MEKNILLTIAYDGSEFHGWQRQPEEKTVQGYLEQTFSRLLRREIHLNGTSRTDAGVHALGQRASFRADIGIPTEKLARVMNNALCGREQGPFALAAVRILEAKEMPLDFHARFDCTGKKYIYRVACGPVNVFRRNYMYHVGEELDAGAMDEAARYLIGTHDFKSFESSGGNPRETTVRTITDARVSRPAEKEFAAGGPAPEPGEIVFEVSGDGFLYNMVRIITGTLVEIGRGRRRPEEMKDIIAAADRTAAGHTAPPYGLYLAEVYYGQ